MRDYGHGPDDRTGDKLMRSCRNDRTEAARRTCRCLLQSRMTRWSCRRRHNFRKNAVRDAENFRLTPMPQISGCKAPGDSLQPEAIGAVMEVTKWLKPSISVREPEEAIARLREDIRIKVN